MRQESAGVTEALLDSARREFMEHGFHGASLRRISADSGVSTNSIYTRFGDKAGLFAAVVGPVADGLMEYYLTCVDQAADTQDSSSAMETGGEGTDGVLQYIYEIVSHKLPFEEAKVFMDNIKQYCFAGWKAVLDHE